MCRRSARSSGQVGTAYRLKLLKDGEGDRGWKAKHTIKERSTL
jgi:hypothetical protein